MLDIALLTTNASQLKYLLQARIAKSKSSKLAIVKRVGCLKFNLLVGQLPGLICAYLIFVISFTQAGFLNSKVLHPKTTQNTHKLQQIPQKDVKYAVICVQSGKFYTGENFFTRAPPVVPVTNMRYAVLLVFG